MARLREAARRESRPLLLFGVGWVSVWVVTIVTWETDTAGASVGIWPGAIPLHVILPLGMGLIIGLRSGFAAGHIARVSLGAATVFWLVHAALFASLDALFWSEPVIGAADSVMEGLAFAIGYLALALGLSVIGGVVGWWWRHRRGARATPGRGGSSDPAVPAVLAGEQPRRIEDLLR